MPPLATFLSDGGDMDNYIQNRLHAYNASITTITSFVTVNTEIHVRKLFEIASEETKWNGICAILGQSLRVRFPGTKKNSKRNHRSFYNSISVDFKRKERTICAKIFRTGIHITGSASFEDCVSAADIMARMIFLVQQETVFVKEYKIQLVNVLLHFGQSLYLQEICDELSQSKINCLYDREVYCGLRVKVPTENGKTCTLIFFPSGKAILAGAKALRDIKAVIDTVIPKVSKFLL